MKTLHLTIIIIGIIGLSLTIPHGYAPCAEGITGCSPPDPIFLTDSRGDIDNFLTNHQILIRADVRPESSGARTDTVEINMTSDTGFTFDDKKQLIFAPNTTRIQQAIWQFIPTKAGNYTIEKISNGVHVSSVFFSVHDSKTSSGSPVLISPLTQFRWGILPENTQCKDNFELILKTDDGSPVCVKLETATKLAQRGWAMRTGSTTQASIVQNTSNKENDATTDPPCVSNVTHQFASAGVMGLPLCPFLNFSASSKILNANGFYGIYNYTVYTGVQNYVLEPGHNGTLTYLISVNSISNWGQTSEYQNNINITNNLEFMHDAGMQDHPGIYVSVYPKSEIMEKGRSALLTITISVSKNAPLGTYWIRLPPGVCAGGDNIILTVADCSKK